MFYSVVLLSIFGILNLFIGFLKSRAWLLPITVLFLLIGLVANLSDWNKAFYFWNYMMSTDNVSVAFTSIIIFSTILILPLSRYFVQSETAPTAEYYAILLFSVVGATMMVGYENLLMLFLGLETLSIAMYILAGSDKRNPRSHEAALKYFLMGAFATGILLFGVAMLYGATGTFGLSGIKQYVVTNGLNGSSSMLMIGITLVLIGILFKLSVAPFHFWTPDVYDGTPSLFTVFMSTVVKTAGFAALYKLLSVSFAGVYDIWWITLAITTVLTLLIGNITAVYQNSFKRMMAYSSISHAGYLLIAVTAMTKQSQSSILFYSLAYSLATITSFAVLILVNEFKSGEQYSSFNGLAKRNPFLAFTLTVAMCSLAGIPLTAGFFGKFYIFISALNKGLTWLLVVAVLMSAVGIYYYFRVVIAMYMRGSEEPTLSEKIVVPTSFQVVLVISTLLTILLGLDPDLIIRYF
jgi:NADH-quinone oxidoreductase subunit N